MIDRGDPYISTVVSGLNTLTFGSVELSYEKHMPIPILEITN